MVGLAFLHEVTLEIPEKLTNISKRVVTIHWADSKSVTEKVFSHANSVEGQYDEKITVKV